MGKMISPQNLATGVAVTALKCQEGVVFARTFKHSLALTAALGVLVGVEQYALPWIIPHQKGAEAWHSRVRPGIAMDTGRCASPNAVTTGCARR
jgi:hypothetical protein